MEKEKIENPIAKIEFEEAKILADLSAIVQDLGSIMKICLRLEEMLKNKSKDSLLIESFWTTALIKYARCFKSGKRFGLDESILDGLKGEPHKAHKFYLDMRDKHVAHSVNPFEQMQVGLMLSPENDNKKNIVGVATLSMKYVAADCEGVNQLGRLSKVFLGKVYEMGKLYENKTLERGKAIPINDLYKYTRLRVTAPGPEESNRPRE
ncbi:MAG: hypothetical protein QMD77_04685 [Patescibacteria group bacterium]|nr:hypothetical protein [Patescibacteria group bacterium]